MKLAGTHMDYKGSWNQFLIIEYKRHQKESFRGTENREQESDGRRKDKTSEGSEKRESRDNKSEIG